MKKFWGISLLFLLTHSPSGAVADQVDVSMCGARPGLLERLLTDAEKIRIRCIDQAYEENRQKLLDEAIALDELQKSLKSELEKVAFEYTAFTLRCHPNRGQVADPERTKKCQEINLARNTVIERMNVVMGWNERPRPSNQSNPTAKDLTPPCPSKEDLLKIQPVRYFNRKLYQTWERCVTLSPEKFYN